MNKIYKKYYDYLQPIRPYRRNQIIKILSLNKEDKIKVIEKKFNTRFSDFSEDEMNKGIIFLFVMGGNALH